MTAKPTRSLSLALSIAAILIVVLVLAFGGGLSISSFRKNYTDSLVASYSVAGGEAIRFIEYGVNEGESLDLFFGLTELLAGVRKDSPGISDVRVVLPDGSIIHDLHGVVRGGTLPEDVVKRLAGSDGNLTVLMGKDYHALLAIRETGVTIVGYLDVVFEKGIVDEKVGGLIREIAFLLFLIGAVAALGILIILNTVPLVTGTGKIRKTAILVIMIGALGLTQIAFGLVNLRTFIGAYVDMAARSAAFTARIIQKELNESLKSELPLASLTGIEDWLGIIVRTVPEIERVRVRGGGRDVFSTAGTGSGESPPADPRYVVSLPLNTDSAGVAGELDVTVSRRYVDDKVVNIALDGLTVLLTSWFFMVEVTLFFLLFLGHRAARGVARAETTSAGTVGEVDFSMVRSLAFLLFTATSMSMSFIPVLMRGFRTDIPGLSTGLLMGLPISVEILTSIAATVITGHVLDTKGWRPPFLLGTAVLAAGTVLSALSGDAWTFILARAVVGVGYGFCWMALRGFASSAPSEEGRGRSFAALNSGIYAGINCGCVTGAMISERIGFSRVFFVAFAVVLVAGVFAAIFYRNVRTDFLEAPGTEAAAAGAGASGPSGFLGFLLNGGVLGFFLLVAIPTAISAVFINYFLPVFSVGTGVTAANTGRAILLYGMCIVYLGPMLSRGAVRIAGAGGATVVASLVMASGLLIFAATGNFLAALIAALFLGVSDSFGMVAQNSYFLRLPAVGRRGVGKSLGMLSIAKKIGQMIGPLALGSVIGLGMARGMGLTGAFLLGCTVLFALLFLRPGDRGKGEIVQSGTGG